MDSSWNILVNVAYISVFIGIAAFIKTKVKVFQKFLIPTSMIAGFLALLSGQELLGLVTFDVDVLGQLVYHLIAIGFIALSLKDREKRPKGNSEGMRTGAFIVSTYLVQAILGFGITLFLSYTIMPALFPPSGLLLPLSFGQGPGQAYSIGLQWEATGFTNGSNVGLTMATLGFLWACIIGVFLLNILLRKVKTRKASMNMALGGKKIIEESESGDMHLTAGLDKITVQLFLIGIAYLATFLTIKGLSLTLDNFGDFGKTISQLLWGFHFIIGTIYAILLRLVLDYMLKKKYIHINYPNTYLLQRISGSAFDYMIAASIAIISLTVLKEYWLPILLLSTAGGIATIYYVIFISKKIYTRYVLEHILAMYGMMTGTISTGLALLKEVDPKFNTTAAENLVLGSATGLMLGFPLMVLLTFPILGYTNNKPFFYILTIAAFILYLGALYLYLYISKTREKKHKQ